MICYLARLIPIFQDWYENGNFVSMLNFTVRDGSPLSEPLNLLETSFRELYHGHNERRGYWKERFPGGIRSAEIKLGANSRKPHPHYHCLVMQEGGKEFVKDYYWMSEAWHSIVGLKTYDARLFCDGSIIQLAEETTRKDGTPDYNWNGNIFIKKLIRKNCMITLLIKTPIYIIRHMSRFSYKAYSSPGGVVACVELSQTFIVIKMT